MAVHKVVLIPGDGIGPEVTSLTTKLFEAADVPIEWVVVELGEPAIKKYGDPFPEDALKTIKKYPVVFKGPLTTPVGGGYRSLNLRLRLELDTYAVVRPAKSLPVDWLYSDVPRYSKLDLVLVREATEGLTQEEAAERMGVSRGTLWRSLNSARKKIADMLATKRPLIIQ